MKMDDDDLNQQMRRAFSFEAQLAQARRASPRSPFYDAMLVCETRDCVVTNVSVKITNPGDCEAPPPRCWGCGSPFETLVIRDAETIRWHSYENHFAVPLERLRDPAHMPSHG